MNGASTEEIALVITGRQAGAVEAAREVSAAVQDTSRVSVEANKKSQISTMEAVAGLKNLGIAARVDAAGGIKVASGDVANVSNLLQKMGVAATVSAGAMDAAGIRSEAAATKQARAMGLAEIAAQKEEATRTKAAAAIVAAEERKVAAATAAAEQEAAAVARSDAAAEKQARAMGLAEVAALKEDEARTKAAADVIAAEERKAAATAAAAEQEAAAMARVEAAAYKENAAREKALASTEKIPHSARRAANGLAVLSLGLASANGSAQGMVNAAGLVTSALSSMAGEGTKFAAIAAGLGASVTIIGTAAVLLKKLYDTAKDDQSDPNGFQQNILARTRFSDAAGVLDASKVAAYRQRLSDAVDAAQKKAAASATGTLHDLFGQPKRDEEALERALADLEAFNKKAGDLGDAEKDRIVQRTFQRKLEGEAMHRAANDERETVHYAILAADAIATGGTAIGQRVAGLAEENRLAKEQVKSRYELRDEEGKLRPLSEQQRADLAAQLKDQDALTEAKRKQLFFDLAITRDAYERQTATLAAAASGNVGDAYAAKMADIAAQEEADRQAGISEIDREARKQAAIRALRKTTHDQALANAGTITEAFISSGNRELKAIGHFGESIRRIVIGAEAARAAVSAARETGEALASAGAGDFRGAALHGASALQFGAAAALGFKESLGGGGSGGGASGGAGSTGADSFTPRNQGGAGGGVTLIVQTVDPTSKAVVANLRYQFGRADTLNVPVPITGGGAVHVLTGAAA